MQLAAAQRALRDEDAHLARRHLDSARGEFGRVTSRLGSFSMRVARRVPLVGRQVRAAAALADAGVLATDAGRAAAAVLEVRPPGGWRIAQGRIDLDSLRRAADAFDEALPPLEEAVDTLEASPGTWLAGPLASGRRDALDSARSALDGARAAAAGLRAAPDLLGADGPRRYVVAFANLAALQGSGGFYGYFAVLSADAGRVVLEPDAGRLAQELPPLEASEFEFPDWYVESYGRYQAHEIWQNVNFTTDFPTVGAAVVGSVKATLGEVDGVIQIDPSGLRPVLRATRPVSVAPWPVPIGADNVESVTQHEAYVHFEDNAARFRFLGRVLDTAFARFLTTDVELGSRLIRQMGEAAAGGHIQVYSAHPAEQGALVAMGVARDVARVGESTDVLGVVSVNAGGNKLDWFLRREATYRVSPDPGESIATGRLELVLRNEGPDDGLPDYVIGSSPRLDDPPPRGTNRQLTMLVRSPGDARQDLEVDGVPGTAVDAREASLRTYHHGPVDVPPGGSVTVSAGFTAWDVFSDVGSRRVYRLHVLRQPVVEADVIRVEVAPAPRGWKLESPAVYEGVLDADLVFEAVYAKTLRARVVDHLFLGPWRALRELVGG